MEPQFSAAIAWYAHAPLPAIEAELRDAGVNVAAGRARFRALVSSQKRKRRTIRALTSITAILLGLTSILLVHRAITSWVVVHESLTARAPISTPAGMTGVRLARFTALARAYADRVLLDASAASMEDVVDLGTIVAMGDREERFRQWTNAVRRLSDIQSSALAPSNNNNGGLATRTWVSRVGDDARLSGGVSGRTPFVAYDNTSYVAAVLSATDSGAIGWSDLGDEVYPRRLLPRTSWRDAVLRGAVKDLISDDSVVRRRRCVGFDCFDKEELNLDVITLKENNLRIKLDDTSTIAGYPTNGWQLILADAAHPTSWCTDTHDSAWGIGAHDLSVFFDDDSRYVIASSGGIGRRPRTREMLVGINGYSRSGVAQPRAAAIAQRRHGTMWAETDDASDALARITLSYYIASSNDRFDAATRPTYYARANTYAERLLPRATDYSEDVTLALLAAYAQMGDERYLAKARLLVDNHASAWDDAPSVWADSARSFSLAKVRWYALAAGVDLGPRARAYADAWLRTPPTAVTSEEQLWASIIGYGGDVGTRFDAVAAELADGGAPSPAASLRAMGAALGRDRPSFLPVTRCGGLRSIVRPTVAPRGNVVGGRRQCNAGDVDHLRSLPTRRGHSGGGVASDADRHDPARGATARLGFAAALRLGLMMRRATPVCVMAHDGYLNPRPLR